MWRSRFEDIMASIHLVDNINITADSFYKVCPLFEKLDKVNKTVSIQAHLSVDEMMIEYFRLHGCKQSVQGKPVCICRKNVRVLPGGKFYHKNFFTTLSLVDEMTREGFGSCGTLLENKLFAAPLIPASVLT